MRLIGKIGRSLVGISTAVVIAVAAGQPTSGQRPGTTGTPVPDGDWRYYGRDAASTKYSPLDQITGDNVKNLKIAWRWKADNFGPSPEYNLQATPLAVNGILYTTAGTRRAVVAIDGATGETLWVYRYDEGDRGRRAPRQNHRGVAYWSDGRGDDRILYITAGYHLIALNPKTGTPIPSFGNAGIVDLFDGLDQPRPADGQIGSSSPPIIIGDIAVVGAALQGVATSKQNVAAHVRGYDVRTGKRVWIFHTIPRPGEFGNETWENDSWSYTGNTGVWTTMSADPDLGYVYLPVETPTQDFYGVDRPGNNLFAESLVCLDARTGKRVWHFQFVHHGIWDYDTPAAPILFDATIGGRRIKAVAQVTKQAFTYVFDRTNGTPVWPIEERPVPQSDAPGEKTSPTQPFPTRPAPFDRQGLTIDELIDFTPELNREARELASQYQLGPIYTPPIVAGTNGLRGTLTLPTATGGANWQGGAFDPEAGVLYVSSGTMVTPSAARQPLGTPPASGAPPAAPVRPAPGAARGPSMFGPQGLPIVKPPYGRITAIDLTSGDHLWMVPNGDTPEWIKNHPALKGVNVPPTGRYEHVGLLVTKTLLFAGEGSGLFAVPPGSGGPMFRALDKKSGRTLFEFRLPANQSGIPMSFLANNRQYIVVAVGAVATPGEFVALTLDN